MVPTVLPVPAVTESTIGARDVAVTEVFHTSSSDAVAVYERARSRELLSTRHTPTAYVRPTRAANSSSESSLSGSIMSKLT